MSTPTTSKNNGTQADEYVATHTLIGVIVLANIGLFLNGYFVGATAWLVYDLEVLAELHDSDSYYDLIQRNPLLLGLIGAIVFLGMFTSLPLLLLFTNNMSKRDEMAIASFSCIVASTLSCLAAVADWHNATGLVLLLTGRFLHGVGSALVQHSCPQYTTEVIPVHLRGAFGSCLGLIFKFGLLTALLVGYACGMRGSARWFLIYSIALVMSMVMMVGLNFLHHNPTWLIHHQYPDEEVLSSMQIMMPHATLDTVTYLKDTIYDEIKIEHRMREEVQRHAQSLRRSCVRSYSLELGTTCVTVTLASWCQCLPCIRLYASFLECADPAVSMLFFNKSMRQCTALFATLFVFNVVSGTSMIVPYSSIIFGAVFPQSETLCMLLFVSIRVLTDIIMVFIGSSTGRRTFMNAGNLLTLAAYGSAFITVQVWVQPYVAFLSLLASVVGYEIMFGTILYPLLNEVVPFRTRSAANAVGMLISYILYFVVILLLPVLFSSIGVGYVLLVFAGISCIVFIMCYILVPETKGSDLDTSYRLVNERWDDLHKIVVHDACHTLSLNPDYFTGDDSMGEQFSDSDFSEETLEREMTATDETVFASTPAWWGIYQSFYAKHTGYKHAQAAHRQRRDKAASRAARHKKHARERQHQQHAVEEPEDVLGVASGAVVSSGARAKSVPLLDRHVHDSAQGQRHKTQKYRSLPNK